MTGSEDDDGFATLFAGSNATSTNANTLGVPGAQNSVGFARKGAAGKRGSTKFRINTSAGGLLEAKKVVGVGNTAPTDQLSCLAARAINPVAANATLELWAKPLAAGSVAVLVVNNGEPAPFNFTLADLDLDSGEAGRGGGGGDVYTVRDVWSHTDVGTLASDGHYTSALGVHDSALLVLSLHTF